MALERPLMFTLLEVPQPDTCILTRRGNQIVERVNHNFGYLGSMALHRIFTRLPRKSIPDARLAAERSELGHAVKLLVLCVFLHLFGLFLQLHDLLFQFDDACPLLFE